MRLSEIRRRREDAPVPAEVEAELEAVDAALRGEPVPPGMESLAALAAEARAQRSEPDPDFAAALDAWAAAGFPRAGRPGLEAAEGSGGEGHKGLTARLGSRPPRRLLAPVGAAATLLVVLAVALSYDGGGGQAPSGDDAGLSPSDDAAIESTGGGELALPESSADAGTGAPSVAPAAKNDSTTLHYGPGALSQDLRATSGLDRNAAAQNGFIPPDGTDRPALGQDVRQVERDAQLTLAAPADEVQGVMNEAVGIVQGYGGVVLFSQSSGTEASARATLQLVIPTRSLDTALDDLSGLGDVKSLTEGAVDITRPYVDAKDRLDALRAERKSLVAQIKVADTEEELDKLKVRLDGVFEQLAVANAEFDNLKRRARLANVTVQITSEGASEGDWSIGDALDDAGRVLTVGAGIALISGAVLLPLGLIAALAYLVLATARRRARERALDD